MMSSFNQACGPEPALNLSPRRIQALLDQLDTRAVTPMSDRRRWPRHVYRAMVAVHPGSREHGDAAIRRVPTRNLSAGGLSFLFHRPLPIDLPCWVRLVMATGAEADAVGAVRFARSVEAEVFEVAIQFRDVIDPARYIPVARGKQILLVEDDPLIARMVSFQLQKMHVAIEWACNGREAVMLALQHPFDLVLMDMMMPEMDGFEATRLLRESGYPGDIVAATGLSKPAELRRCLEAGCNSTLVKPYTAQQLMTMLQESDKRRASPPNVPPER